MNANRTKPEEFSPRQAALELGYTLGYVYSLIYSGQFESARRVDGQWRIPAGAVEQRRQQRQQRESSTVVAAAAP